MSLNKQHTYASTVRRTVVARANRPIINRMLRSARMESVTQALVAYQKPTEVKPKLLQKEHSTSSGMSDFSKLKERNGLEGKAYWNDVIDEVELAASCRTRPRIPVVDYSLVLPPRLRERVKRIQDYDFSKSDDDIYIRDDMREDRPEDYMSASTPDSEEEEVPLLINLKRKVVEEYFNESEHSDIVRMDHEFEKFDLRLDEPVGHSYKTVDKTSWYAKFLCTPSDKRVCWQSRVEHPGQSRSVYTLDEQAEDLMDAAKRFVEWLNSFGTMESSLTPEKVKNLFSIKGDRTLLASVKTDPKEVNAIAQTVADKWNKPHMAIELKYEKHINDQASRVSKAPIISAFGRTVPVKERPWVKRSNDTAITTVYPEELLTREKIFKGITHLRSTSALIDFYLANPSLERPEYLLQSGDFAESSASESVNEVPLYELLGLRY
uniref:GA20919 n=1 Tax=Drosophila miranda TaxID=7229 RepID=D0QWM7_DROMI|nr:GA20919 [Drosophila miranda]